MVSQMVQQIASDVCKRACRLSSGVEPVHVAADAAAADDDDDRLSTVWSGANSILCSDVSSVF